MGNLRVMLLAIFASATVFQICSVQATFSDSTHCYWAPERHHVTVPDNVDLYLTQDGGSGFTTNNSYLYGNFTVQIKLVPGNSAGTVTTFYLSSEGDKHDEIDYEFLGNTTGKDCSYAEGCPYTIHTNVFTQGVGQREQQFKAVWFDPTDGYHTYTILWNLWTIVWLVDGQPIRVFRNHHDTEINYPDAQPMNVYASLWNADDWATQGGRVKTDWSKAPFKAQFQGFNSDGCVANDEYSIGACSSTNPPNYWNDAAKHFKLSDSQYTQMQYLRANYMIYDYCEKAKSDGVAPKKECGLPQN